MNIQMRKLDGAYAIVQLPPAAAIPAWCDGDGFVSISRGDDELSVVCLKERVPGAIANDGEWACLKLIGPFAFDETGIILSVVMPLSQNDIGIFVVSTFNGDYLLVQNSDLHSAIALLTEAGHSVL